MPKLAYEIEAWQTPLRITLIRELKGSACWRGGYAAMNDVQGFWDTPWVVQAIRTLQYARLDALVQVYDRMRAGATAVRLDLKLYPGHPIQDTDGQHAPLAQRGRIAGRSIAHKIGRSVPGHPYHQHFQRRRRIFYRWSPS